MPHANVARDRSRRQSRLGATCESQTRLMIAEHSAMVARMAAALTHELNSPVGALVSSIDTARSVLAKLRTGSRVDANRLAQIEEQLEHVAREATGRIDQVVSRMQRYANLYGANCRPVRLADLITDVIGLLDPALRQRATIHVNVPADLTAQCQPDQISTVVSILLHHLLERVPRLTLNITGAKVHATARLLIASPAIVLTDQEMRCLGAPGKFAPCTWNLYAARQILLAQKGDLRISSDPAAGTVFKLLLPVQQYDTIPCAAPPEGCAAP